MIWGKNVNIRWFVAYCVLGVHSSYGSIKEQQHQLTSSQLTTFISSNRYWMSIILTGIIYYVCYSLHKQDQVVFMTTNHDYWLGYDCCRMRLHQFNLELLLRKSKCCKILNQKKRKEFKYKTQIAYQKKISRLVMCLLCKALFSGY